jgi:hypothetical protein
MLAAFGRWGQISDPLDSRLAVELGCVYIRSPYRVFLNPVRMIVTTLLGWRGNAAAGSRPGIAVWHSSIVPHISAGLGAWIQNSTQINPDSDPRLFA